MAVNLTTTYSPLIQERFKAASFTDAYAGKKYTFDGSKSIVVYAVNKATLNDYNRTTDPTAGSRFGAIAELGDVTQTLTMGQDKSFTFSIDSGNKADQLNIKQVNDQLKSNWDEVCTPAVDTYRFLQWANYCGTGTVGAAITTTTAMTQIMTASAQMSNRLVPKRNRTLFISETAYIACKLSTEIVGIPNMGQASITNGKVGTIDGMDVIVVPDVYLPTGVNFLIKFTDSTVDPMKLKVLRVQKNPLGVDGDVGECRFYHDAFVLDTKASGIFVYATTGNMVAMPTLNYAAGNITFTSAGTTSIDYTLDGTSPKTSSSKTNVLAASYGTNVPIAIGQTIRATAKTTGTAINSPIAEYTRLS